jgi:hypothetical protein
MNLEVSHGTYPTGQAQCSWVLLEGNRGPQEPLPRTWRDIFIREHWDLVLIRKAGPGPCRGGLAFSTISFAIAVSGKDLASL